MVVTTLWNRLTRMRFRWELKFLQRRSKELAQVAGQRKHFSIREPQNGIPRLQDAENCETGGGRSGIFVFVVWKSKAP